MKDSESGYTLLEILVSISLIAIAFPSFTVTMLALSQRNFDSKIRAEGYSVTTEALDLLRAKELTDLPSSGAGTGDYGDFSFSVDGNDYEVDIYYCLNNSYCGADSRHLTARTFKGAEQINEIEVVFANFD